jgi:hypothetical protein
MLVVGYSVIAHGDMINITGDTVSEFEGTFEFTQNNPAQIAFATVFPHFSLSSGTFDNAFEVDDLAGGFQVRGLGDGTVSYGAEQYTATVGSFGDRVDIFQGADGSTFIKYEYRNVQLSALNVLSGQFRFSVVPEPMTLSLVSIAGVGIIFWHHRSPRREPGDEA